MILSLAARGASPADARHHFDLRAGDAAEMLNEFSRQSNLQVLFDFNLLRGIRTHEVHGVLEPSAALATMLADTKLVVEFVNERTVTVSAQPEEHAKPLIPHRRQAQARATEAVEYGPPRPEALAQVLISSATFRLDDRPLGAQLIDLSRADIDQSGLATAQDFLRTLPQVFGGGPGEHTFLGREAGTNSAYGSGVNLRGLNAGATLILVDGRRMAPSGTQGAFLDISNIPLTAVDHVEVMPDGASAVYGADAVGGVVNFVMRDDFQGAQTQLRGGTVTDGTMGQHQFGQLFGTHWDSGKATLALEYYHRDALLANDRPQNHSDLRPFGGDDFDEPMGTPGTITDGTHFWLIPRGQHGTPLTAAQLIPAAGPYLSDRYGGTDITPDETRWNAFGRTDHSINDDVNIFFEGLYSQRRISVTSLSSVPIALSVPSTNPYYVNPAGGTNPVTVLYGSATDFGPLTGENRIDTGNFALGADLAMTRNWNGEAYLGYTYETQHEIGRGLYDPSALATAVADSNPQTAFNPFGDGSNTNPATLANIGETGLFHLSSSLWSAGFMSTGPLFGEDSHSPRLSLGAEYRLQSFATVNRVLPVQTLTSTPTDSLARNVQTAFSELRIPLSLPGRWDVLASHPMEIALGIRYEHFSDVGSVLVPKYGLSWSPLDDLSMRATWSKAFKPPNLPDIDPKGTFVGPFTVPDPMSSTGTTTALLRIGTNTDLKPESARIWTLGADYKPKVLPELSLSFTYFDIRYSGRIDETIISPEALQRPDLAWIVTRNVPAGTIAEICKQVTNVSASPCENAEASGVIIDDRLHNLTLLKTRGVDFIGRYHMSTPVGELSLGANGTYLTEYSQSYSPASPFVDLLNTQRNPLRFRLRGALGWQRADWDVSTYVNYYSSYRDIASIPARSVDGWSTVDLRIAYEPRIGPEWLSHVQIAISAQNLFDSYPPFLNNVAVGLGYDQENGDLTGRFVAISLRKSW